jgi:hypothetical protein
LGTVRGGGGGDARRTRAVADVTSSSREPCRVACSLVTQEHQRRARKLERSTNALGEHRIASASSTLDRNIGVSGSLEPSQSFSLSSQCNSCFGGDPTGSLVDYFLPDNLCYISGT